MRIDKAVQDNFGSRNKAAQAISSGLVLVNGKPVQASYNVKDTDVITIRQAAETYVSAGGFKLAKALMDFMFPVQGLVCADIGASTGGFTDCLFQNGASKVYCIDVGENQLDPSLLSRNVVIIDNYNARNLTADIFKEPLDLVTIDVSFISLTYILGAVSDILPAGKHVLALIKPQFEMDSPSVGKNGIVREPKQRRRAVSKILEFAAGVGLAPRKITEAPRREGKNLEYVVLLEKEGDAQDEEKLLEAAGL
ncbi:MAG: TlyA family RNA methyltransferase [Clostridia bacterium]|nr:TlyA family RNA methyltransferase [Clostridia bacterium]